MPAASSNLSPGGHDTLLGGETCWVSRFPDEGWKAVRSCAELNSP